MTGSDRRARVGAVAWSLSYLVLGLVGMAVVTSAAAEWMAAVRPDLAGSLIGAAAIQAGAGILVFGALSWAIGRRALRMTREELGWASWRTGLPGFGRGLGVGLAIGVGSLAAGLLAGSAWRLDGGRFGDYLVRVGFLFVALLPPALMEELAFRGVAVAGMARGLGRGGAIVVTSVIFALVHRANPGVTPLALGNIALAGVFLGLTFFARGGLWTATGAHLGWNLSLAALAAPVSGLPFEIPWLDFDPGLPAWVTGGGFGSEGGVLATVALAAGVVLVRRWSDSREAT